MIVLNRPKSKNRVEIITDQQDSWFMYVNHVNRSTGEVIYSSMIVEKDLTKWLSYLDSQGWKIQE
jgi:hypothetical protein